MTFNEKKNYKRVYDYRTNNEDGVCVRHIHQSISLEQNKNGKA